MQTCAPWPAWGEADLARTLDRALPEGMLFDAATAPALILVSVAAAVAFAGALRAIERRDARGQAPAVTLQA